MQKGEVCLLAYDLLSGTWLDHSTSEVAHNDAPHLSHRVGCRGEFQVMSPRTCGLGGVPPEAGQASDRAESFKGAPQTIISGVELRHRGPDGPLARLRGTDAPVQGPWRVIRCDRFWSLSRHPPGGPGVWHRRRSRVQDHQPI